MLESKKNRYDQLMQAIKDIEELKIPELLQSVALEYLLRNEMNAVTNPTNSVSSPHTVGKVSSTQDLRTFVSTLKNKGAVSEIPSLIYWAKSNEGVDMVDEKGIVELYRRAGLRPPKNVSQSMRDLCSKKYGRLEVVEGHSGNVKISRVGEDIVIHEIIGKE